MTSSQSQRQAVRRKAVWGPKRTFTALLLMALGFSTSVMTADGDERRSTRLQSRSQENRHRKEGRKARPVAPNSQVKHYKLDDEVTRRSTGSSTTTTRVIVTMQPGVKLPADLARFARGSGNLDIINGEVLDLPNSVIRQLERHPDIFRVHHDRPAGKENYRTAVTVGAERVRSEDGYSGKDIGIAVIDSGITPWHDDLTVANRQG